MGSLSQEFTFKLWLDYLLSLILPSTLATIRIVFKTILLGGFLGFGIAIILILTREGGLRENSIIYRITNFLINTIRSFPILILIVALSPITRKLVGTSVGEKSVIFPLSIACTCFIARSLENCFNSVDKQLIEAAQSFGASNIQIVFRVIVRESIPNIINTFTLATIMYISGSTIAGAVGGGGLGAVALNYGYQSFNDVILYTSVIVLFLLVQIVQCIGNILYKKSL